MLTRSQYKPLLTYSKNSTVVLFKQDKQVDASNSGSKQLAFETLKSRISSLSSLGFLSQTRLQLVDSSQVVAVPSSFGIVFVKKTLSKIVGQVPGTETPVFAVLNSKAIIPVSLCGKRVAIYNGKLLMPVLIKRSMLGFSFRQMVRCKRLGRIIHANSDKKNKR